MNLFHRRQGQMTNDVIYFFTATINNFYPLLNNDQIKTLIIDSLSHLVKNNLAVVYAFVIMPNHIHLIWKTLGNNGNETTVGSFMKFTAHQFQKYLRTFEPNKLDLYKSNVSDRSYHFWKRDPLAIPLSSINILEQKLSYIHRNPLQEKWKLTDLEEDYRWSSAKFYEKGIDEFGILTHHRD
ncbi:MAG: transposase [Pedobacter sp.]|uniref:transposase n=1 Tax=Pedobacter sp. TaxID=1411316 RepID=UPI002806A5EC|nr:transposase [Pedobacter sp.]MDQ8006224.1 transposase [Pedobacter sp.]